MAKSCSGSSFFKDASILILDDLTVAIDPQAEYRLFKKFEDLTKNKTIIIISHRFSTVRIVDRIVLLEKGKITEQGSHLELLAKQGLYAKLFKLQVGGMNEY